jgi:hypothetical protein
VTDAEISSFGWIARVLMVTEALGYISYHAEYWATPRTTSASMPVCSTELELEPSIPTQTAEYAVPEPVTVGTVHSPLTAVTDPAAAFTAYPDQLLLLSGFQRGSSSSARSGTCGRVGRTVRDRSRTNRVNQRIRMSPCGK